MGEDCEEMMKRPRVIVHTAVSADASSVGFMPDMELFYGLLPTWKEDATITGADTLLRAFQGPEKEELPLKRQPNSDLPVLYVTDTRGRFRRWAELINAPFWGEFVAVISDTTPSVYIEYLDGLGISHFIAGDERTEPQKLLSAMYERGIRILRIDSGGQLTGLFLRQRLVDEVSLLVEPYITGGNPFCGLSEGLEQPLRMTIFHVERIKADIMWLRYQVLHEG